MTQAHPVLDQTQTKLDEIVVDGRVLLKRIGYPTLSATSCRTKDTVNLFLTRAVLKRGASRTEGENLDDRESN